MTTVLSSTTTTFQQNHHDQHSAQKRFLDGEIELAGPAKSQESQQAFLQGPSFIRPTLPIHLNNTSTGVLTPLASSPSLAPTKHYRDIAPRRASTSNVLTEYTFAHPRNLPPLAPRQPGNLGSLSNQGRSPVFPISTQKQDTLADTNQTLAHIRKVSRSFSVASVTSTGSTHSSISTSTRTPRLRDSHKLAERRRRKEMNGCFEALRGVLPKTLNQTNDSVSDIRLQSKNIDSKHDILNRATEYLDRLVATEAFLINERTRLQNFLATQERTTYKTQQARSGTKNSVVAQVTKK